MSDELRAGIIGAGFIDMVHVHAVRAAGGIVRRAAASTPERSLDAAGRLGAEGAATAEDLIDAEDVDVVHICAPNSRHTDLALRAIRGRRARDLREAARCAPKRHRRERAGVGTPAGRLTSADQTPRAAESRAAPNAPARSWICSSVMTNTGET